MLEDKGDQSYIRQVIDADGFVEQQTDYYPYGLPMATTHTLGAEKNPYKFGAKEYETENSLNQYDFEARTHLPALAQFSTIDRKAGDYPFQNPYLYCAGNPIAYIDPTGEDVFSVDKDGYIRHHEITDDDFDTLIASETNASINVPKQTFTPQFSGEIQGKKGYVKVDLYDYNGHDSELHEFLASNTEVEWSSIQYVTDGNELRTRLGTSHDYGSDNSLSKMANNITEESGSIMVAIHNHTNNSAIVSEADINVANNIATNHQYAEFYIMTVRPNIKYTQYSPTSNPGQLDEVIVYGKSPNKNIIHKN